MIEYNIIKYVNCLDPDEGLSSLPDKIIDLIVTSPPYFNSSKKYQRGKGIHYTKDIGEPLYSTIDCSEILYKKLKDDGFYCLNLGFSYAETGVMRPFYIIDRLLKKQKWFLIDTIIWHKKNPIPIQKRLTNSWEYIFVLSKHPNLKYPNPELGYKHNFFESSVAISKGNFSAPFPEALPHFCIEVFSRKGELICDPFVGSGTTCIVANKLSRNWIGYEINDDYKIKIRKSISNINSPKNIKHWFKTEENK